MATKLYVSNLPEAASAHALRTHFNACGVVSDVQIVPDRSSGRGRDSAYVRMASAADAERALSLNGALFAGQLLVVEVAPGERDERRVRGSRGAEANDDDPKARVTLQFREPANMTYELDCSGIPVVVRVFFQDTEGQWRVTVQANGEADTASSAAAGPSRIEAFRAVAQACREGVGFGASGRIDWSAIEGAMLKVRAL